MRKVFLPRRRPSVYLYVSKRHDDAPCCMSDDINTTCHLFTKSERPIASEHDADPRISKSCVNGHEATIVRIVQVKDVCVAMCRCKCGRFEAHTGLQVGR
jgi:hypothetical protein